MANGDRQRRQLHQALTAPGVSFLLDVDVRDLKLMLGSDLVKERDEVHFLVVQAHVLQVIKQMLGLEVVRGGEKKVLENLKLGQRLAISIFKHLMELRHLVAVLIGQCRDVGLL